MGKPDLRCNIRGHWQNTALNVQVSSDSGSPAGVASPVAVAKQLRLSPEGRSNALIEAVVGGATELLRVLGVGKR